MRIDLNIFGGIFPGTADRKLPDGAAIIAENTELKSDRIDVYKTPLQVETLTGNGGTPQTIYYHGGEWLHWAYDVDVVKTPVNDDQYDRIYYTNPYGAKKMYVRGKWDEENYEERPVETPRPLKPTIDQVQAFEFDNDIALIFKMASNTECDFVSAHEMSSAEKAAVDALDDYVDDTIFELEYDFPGQYTTSTATVTSGLCAAPVYQLRFANGERLPDSLTCGMESVSNEIQDIEDSDGEVLYTVQILDIEQSDEDTGWSPAGATVIYHNPCTIKVRVKVDPPGTAKDYFYLVRYVRDDGTLGPPNEISVENDLVQLKDGYNAKLTFNHPEDLPDYIKQVKIYRSAGDGGTATNSTIGSASELYGFMLVDEVDLYDDEDVFIDDLSYTDERLDNVVISEMPEYGNPPEEITGLLFCAGGFMVGFKGKDIYFSEPFLPHTWPAVYSQTVAYNIIGLAAVGNTIYVMTTADLFAFSGSSPEKMFPINTAFAQGCASKQSICMGMGAAFYATPDGLAMASGSSVNLITDKFFRRRDWRDKDPDNMIIEIHDQALHIVSPVTHMILDMSAGKSALTTVEAELTIEAMHVLPENDELCLLLDDRNIVKWNEGADSLTATWESKIFRAERPIQWQTVKVVADSYPSGVDAIKLTLTSGSAIQEVMINSAAARRIQFMRPDNEWRFKVETAVPVDQVIVATSMAEV